ncbi:MAG TPA: Ger(x)C family spore germination protein [Symbiobacteriaceae bacterium]|nr:Ger(x)C family spore germination protein [Symbiobacteriaceae bacterium]
MKRRATLLGLAAMLLLTGCWDLREMNHLALVVAVGVDKSPTPGRVQVTIQVARPSGAGKGGGTEAGPHGAPVYIATADGDTIFAAIRNLAQFTSRRIMWAHNNVVIIGESLARDDITPVIDFFTRNQELRMRTWVAVSRGTEARNIVSARTGMEDIPANSISALLRFAQLPGEGVHSDMGDALSAYLSKDQNPVLAVLELQPRGLSASEQPEAEEPLPQARLAGSAIINNTRLVGFVERETGRGLLWLRRDMKNAVLTIPCPGGAGSNMAIEIRSPNVQVASQIVGSTPVMHFSVHTDGWLTEQDCPTPKLRTTELKRYAQQALADKIKAEMQATLALLQHELKTDAIKYARTLHIQQPQWWDKNSGRWDKIFPDVQTRIAVTVTISRMSLYTRPMRAESP